MCRLFLLEINRILSENVPLLKKVSWHRSTIDLNVSILFYLILAARHAAFRYDCKFVETSAAINDKVDDLLAGTLKQIRISEQQRRRSTVTNGNDPIESIESNSSRRGSIVLSRGSKNIFTKFFNVFRKKPMKLPADVENLNTGIR